MESKRHCLNDNITYGPEPALVGNKNLHRKNKPALIRFDGEISFYENEKRHREGNKPSGFNTINGAIAFSWYKNGHSDRTIWKNGQESLY